MENNDDDFLNDATQDVAAKFWEHVASVPSQMRLTADRLRLADTECRLAMEALVDASCKTLPVRPELIQEDVARQKAVYEAVTINRLEAAAVGAAKKRVVVATNMLSELETILDKFEDSDSSSADEDDETSCRADHKKKPYYRKVPKMVPTWPVDRDPATGLEVHTLVSPDLSSEDKYSFIPCQRPARKGGVRLEAEEIRRQEDDTPAAVVYHNYGHSGAGWSISSGCVDHMLEAEFLPRSVPRDEPVAIVGAGVIGLFTAWRLLQHGYKNLEVFADTFDDDSTTSHRAGGLITFFAQDTPNDEARRVLTNAACQTLSFWAHEVLAGKHEPAIDRSVVQMVPRFMGDLGTSEDAAVYATVGLCDPPRKALVRFEGSKSQKTHELFMIDDACMVQVQDVMRSLSHFLFDSSGVKATSGHIESLATDVPRCYRHIFNCTGAGSKELVGDDAIDLVGGHSVALHNQPQRFLDNCRYVLDFCERLETPHKVLVESSAPGTREPRELDCGAMLYFVPKGDGFFGGSFVCGMQSDDLFPRCEFDRIVKEAVELTSA